MTYTPASVHRAAPVSMFVSPYSKEASAFVNLAPASGTISLSPSGMAFPIVLPVACVARRLWWLNGVTVGTDTMQVGIYDANGVSVVLGTATTTSGANVVQFDDITDTSLPPGRYWLACRCSGSTATFFRAAGSVNIRVLTAAIIVPSGALPANLSGWSTQSPGNSLQVPVFGFTTRATP